MKTRSIAFALTLALIAGTAGAQSNTAAEADIKKLLAGFVDAQRSFDLATIDASLAPDYIEISPVGEVDPRAKVLSFYAPDKKVSDTPIAALDEFNIRVYGPTAITIARLTYSMKGPNGAPTSRSMRCVFMTRLIDSKWKISSSQFTPIRQ